MRTLKKTLCLVLVLAMMVGLCAMGASAAKIDDYKDKDAITHKEAVAVLSAISVLQGDEGGFRPTDTLTRAEGAKILTALHNTQGAGVSSYTDMGSAAWAQPYVAYCEQNSIIAGYGDGTFGPQDKLTGAAFAKMLLCALGYDASLEGLTGSAWEINVVKLVNKINLAAGITTIDWNAPITRDDAAQMAFNALKATMVEYNGNVKVTTGDGTKVEVGANAQAIGNSSYDYRNELFGAEQVAIMAALLGRDVNTMQLCETYFPNLKLKTGETDDFGMPQNIWYMGDNRVDPIVSKAKTIVSALAGNIMATYDTSMFVTEKQIYTTGNLNETGTNNNVLKVIENGVTRGYYKFFKDGGSLPFMAVGLHQYSKDLAGATIYLLDTNDANEAGYGIADTLVVKYPYLAKVSGVTAATPAKDRSIDLNVYVPGAAGKYTTTTLKFTTEDFAKNDYVLVYPNAYLVNADANLTAATEVLDVVKPETANGTLTQVTVKNTVASALTIGGVSYPVGAKGLANLGPGKDNFIVATAAANYGLRLGNTVFLSNGFVMGVLGDSVAYSDYVYLIKSLPANTTLANGMKTGFVKQDGTAIEVASSNIVEDKQGATKRDDQYFDTQTVAVWGTATEGAGGLFSIKPAAALTYKGTSTEINPKNPTISTDAKLWDDTGDATTIVADAKTAFIVFDGRTYKTYTGISNIPNFKVASGKTAMSITALVPSAGAHAAAIFVNLAGAEEVNANTKTIFLVNGNVYSSKSVDGATDLYNFTAIIDGELKEIPATDSAITAATRSGLVVPKYNTKNYLMDTGTVDAHKSTSEGGAGVAVNHYTVENDTDNDGKITAKGLAISGGIITVKGIEKSIVLADGATAYVYDALTGVLSVKEPADIDGYEGILSIEPVSSRDPSAKAIYLVQRLPEV